MPRRSLFAGSISLAGLLAVAVLAGCAPATSTGDAGADRATIADLAAQPDGAATDDVDDASSDVATAVDADDDARDSSTVADVNDAARDAPTPSDAFAPDADECAGRAATCPSLAAATYPAGTGLRAIERCAYGLEDTGERATRAVIIAALESRLGRRTLADVLANLNRSATRITSLAGMPSFRRGFRWDAGDSAVAYWYPQGLTSSADASASGRFAGRFVMMASWYYQTASAPAGEPIRGTRLSIADATNIDDVRYRLVLLVRPTMVAGGVPSFEPLLNSSGTEGLHAGGIVWWNHFLYVADTSGGYRVFDTDRVLEVPTDDDRRIGYSALARAYGAFNYRYVLPEIARYRDATGTCTNFAYSFVGLDRSSTPPTLVSGEYVNASTIGRLIRYRIEPASGELVSGGGVARPSEAWVSAETNMQGAFSRGGTWWLSSSGAMRSLHRARPATASTDYAWPYGCEDLTYDATSGLLWTLTEHPNERYVAAALLSDLGG